MAQDRDIKWVVGFGMASAAFGILLPILSFHIGLGPLFNIPWGNLYGLGSEIVPRLFGNVAHHYLWLQLVSLLVWPLFILIVTIKLTSVALSRVNRRAYVYGALLLTLALCLPVNVAHRLGLATSPTYFGM